MAESNQFGAAGELTEAVGDVEKLQSDWTWMESLNDGGLKVRINGREFYVRYHTNGDMERFTPWDNYFPE